MRRQFTLTDVMDRWNAITGSAEEETRQRVRVLREDGFLPAARTRVTSHHIACFIIGMMSGRAHAEAPEYALAARDAECVGGWWTGDEGVSSEELPQWAPPALSQADFGAWLSMLLKMIGEGFPYEITELMISTPNKKAAFETMSAKVALALSFKGGPTFVCDYEFRSQNSDAGVFPMQSFNLLPGRVLHELAKCAGDVVPGRFAREQAERSERTIPAAGSSPF